ncbi:unnamed protein product [Blepharisma stoltei]|uniref:Phosphatidylinositol N-acetylglucosaminyltransferase subunit H conserved domain-containing protein n=1 Tax=Blepharisma stoltei TaxID=1481888 RepID=A0AAU9JA78_9CILI|nr:unnamed protein product [Blepharisma stoltei]
MFLQWTVDYTFGRYEGDFGLRLKNQVHLTIVPWSHQFIYVLIWFNCILFKMKFSIDSINETQTIRTFTCSNHECSPLKLALTIAFLSIFGFYLKQFWTILIIVYLWQKYTNEIIEETLCVIKGVGIQITEVKRNWGTSHLFIELSDIREIIINEGLTPYDVITYIGIILHKHTKLILPFKKFSITQDQAKEIYLGARELLFE